MLAVLVLGACAMTPRVSPDSPVGRGRAQLEAGRYAEARDAFQLAVAANAGDAAARMGLGAAYEGLGQLDSARAVYDQLAVTDLPGRVRTQVAARLQVVNRRELEMRAKHAVAAEAELAQLPPEPTTLAVFPFRYVGRRQELRALERGLAHIVVTDLAKVRSLTLLERQQVQFLVDELRLTESGRVDPGTGARSGRLLRAGQVLQGLISDVRGTERLRMDVSVVRTTTAEVAANGSAADRLRDLFDLEKEVLFQVLERLGIVVTPAEREAIAERPTASLQAFLAFSRGLEAEDRGDFEQAAREYREAARLDPTFEAAPGRAASVDAIAGVDGLPLTQVAGLATPPPPAPSAGFLTDNLNVVIPSGVALGQQIQAPTGIAPPSTPNQLGELIGGGQVTPPGAFGTLVITVRRPQ